jgi:hypothetical protein
VDQLKLEAERLRLGILYGWRTPRDAVAWADTQIAELSEPGRNLIDLSLAAREDPWVVADLLSAVPGRVEAGLAMRAALGDLLALVLAAPERAAEVACMLNGLRWDVDLPAAHTFAPIVLCDEWSEYEWKGGDPAVLLLKFLREHSDPPEA